MATLYKNNIPYSDNNAAVTRWASDNSVGTVSSASIDGVRIGQWDLTVNGSVVRSFAGAPSAMTGLYELFKAGGGDDASFSVFIMAVTPTTDMTDVDVTATQLTITGHTWEDYSGRPMVIFYDGNNRVISSISVTGSEVVTIPANTDRIVVGASGATPVFYSPIEIPPYVHVADRRPMFVSAWASQKMTQGPAGSVASTGENWGVNQQNYRKAPVSGSADSAFTSTATNGPLAWSTANHLNTDRPLDLGFERITYSFISGWTCLREWNGDVLDGNGGRSGAPQPHYPSNAYGGLFNTQTTVYTDDTNTPGSFTSFTPFTDTGLPAAQGGTKGDLERCWQETVTAAKNKIIAEGGTPEVIAYAGYRPFYTDNTMSTLDRGLIGYSKQSDRGGWTGTGGAPGYTPTPGQVTNGNPGYSNSNAAFINWWGYELEGLQGMGFDGIGLDTGAAMWWNANGMTGVAENEGDSPGSPRLHDIFYSYGMAAQVEAVNWDGRGQTTKPWGGADGTGDNNAGEIYEVGPAWGLAGTTVGWVGRTQDSHELVSWNGESVSPGDGTLYANVYNKDGLLTPGTATVGDPVEGGCAVPLIGPTGKGTEVHSIWRFNNAVINALFANFTWDAIKQIMWDFHDAGLILGSGGSTAVTVTDKDGTSVTAKEFNEYVLDLAANPTQVRPGSVPPPNPNPLPAGVAARLIKPAASITNLDVSAQGWLEANNAYETLESATASTPTQGNFYPRLRVSGTGVSRICNVDVDFGTSTVRDNFLDVENDSGVMKLRLTVTDAVGTVLAIAESDVIDQDANPWPPSPTNGRIQVKLDVASFTTGTAPNAGDSVSNWDGLGEGWVLDGGYTIEFINP